MYLIRKMKKVKPIRTAIHKDSKGNSLVIEHYPAFANIFLKLSSERRKRSLGTLDFSSRVLFVKREKAKHLFRKMNAYGINHYLLKEAKLFDNINLHDEYHTWIIPRTFVLDEGNFLNFSNHGGFELQIFISLDKIKKFIQEPSI